MEDEASHMVNHLRITTKVFIIYGYMLIVYLFCGCFAGMCMYHMYQSWVRIDKQMELATQTGELDAKMLEECVNQQTKLQRQIRQYEFNNQSLLMTVN
jgi:hypothetical protein